MKSFFLVAVGLVLFTLGVRFGFALLATIILALKVSAFSLLGPFEEWQTPALGYNPLGNEVGAPKNLGEEYRWNVPVITYGFDESFMDYFGVLGVAAVDDAFFYLNALPTASAAELGNFSIDSRRFNFRAQAENIVDLKSVALGLMIEQLGLANPERYVWCLRDREAFSQPAITNYYVVNRNFDPESLLPSPFINETRYSYSVFEWATPQFADAGEYAVDPEHSYASAAGQFTQLYGGPEPGLFLNGITRDDFGGLKYLLSSNNINVEILPVGTGAKDGSTNFVNFALRPGVEKLKFEKISEVWYASATWSKTFEFTDTYILDGTRRQQQLVRTVKRPDIVFSAGDPGTQPGSVLPLAFARSSPNWTSPEREAPQAGPGTLRGPVTIAFAKMGAGYINQFPGYTTEGSVISGQLITLFKWGWFNGSIAPIISFPIGVAQGFPSVLRVEENIPESPDLIFWNLSGYPNVEYTIESSVDLRNWSEYQRVSSPSGGYSFTTSKTTNEPVRFFRVSSRAGF